MPITAVQAIRYARHERVAAENFIGGDDHATAMPLDYFVWAIHRSEGPPILVDTGFGAEAAARRGRTIIRPLEDGLAAAGVDLGAVADVILTHLHYDHAGSMALFPNARFHVQDAEMAFATGRAMTLGAVRAPFDGESVAELVRHLFADRVVFHDGSDAIAPGVRVHPAGGHTAGLQMVEVACARGPVLLISDAAHLYANLTRAAPFPIVVDVPAYLETQRRILAMAPLTHVIPGHDPLVLQLFPSENDIARVDLAPLTWPEELA